MLKDKIKEIRKSKGITQKALGDMIGVHESTIRAYETGRSKVNNDIVEKIAAALEICPRELIAVWCSHMEKCDNCSFKSCE